MKKTLLATASVCGLLLAALPVAAQTASTHSAGENVAVPGAGIGGLLAEQDKAQDKKRSPWLLLPLVASSPKMGTSFGALGAYLRVFDPQSQVSMFGAIFEYTSTDSMVGGLFARTSFGADHHRIEGLVGFGYIKNEYEDYLGTGKPFQTTDDLRMVAGRYLYRVKGNWFIGAQSVFANYQISGATELDDKILDVLGITGVQSGGIGAAVMFDSRDNQDMPTRGWYAALNNVANRDWLGAGDNYDGVPARHQVAPPAWQRPRACDAPEQPVHARRAGRRTGVDSASGLQDGAVPRSQHVVVRGRGAHPPDEAAGGDRVCGRRVPLRREEELLRQRQRVPVLRGRRARSSSSPRSTCC